MKYTFILFVFISFFSVAQKKQERNPILNILDNSKKEQFSLGTYLDIGMGSIFKPKNKNQAYFLEAIKNKDYASAFNLWKKHIEGSSFSRTSSGKALYGFLLFKNNFPILGLSQLFYQSRPQKIHSSVYNLWNKEINFTHPAWDYFIYSGSDRWNTISDKNALFKVASKKPFDIYRDKNRIKYLLSLPTLDSIDKFSLEWQMALTTIKEKNRIVSTQILDWLVKKSKPKQKDKVHLTIARLLNNIGEQEASLFYYQKVGKQVPFWISAQEEQAWIYYRRGEYDKAFQSVASLLHPYLKEFLSPYGILIISLSQLKYCDYPGVLESLNYFKDRFSVKYNSLKKIASNPSSTIDELRKYHVSQNKVAHSQWPVFIEKNITLRDQLLLLDFIKRNDSVAVGSTPLMRKKISKMTKQIEKFVGIKIKKSARKELSQINKVLEWIPLVEVDSLYRVYGFHNKNSNSFFRSDQKKLNYLTSKKLISFPYEKEEIWWDELGQYKSLHNESCPGKSYVF